MEGRHPPFFKDLVLPPSLSFPFLAFFGLSLSLALQGQGFLLPLVSRSNALRPETPPDTERDGEGRKDMGFIMEVGETQESEIAIHFASEKMILKPR